MLTYPFKVYAFDPLGEGSEEEREVVEEVASTVRFWLDREEYARLWHLDTLGSYEKTAYNDKVNYIKVKAFKILDRRFNDFLDSAEEDTAVAAVRKTRDIIQSEAKIEVSKGYKLKLKSNLFQRRFLFNFENPFMKSEAELRFPFGLDLRFAKDFDFIQTDLNCDIDEKKWMFSLYRKLSSHVTVRFIMKEGLLRMPDFKSGNNRLEILYNSPF